MSEQFQNLKKSWAEKSAFYLAPMAGLTNAPFRRLLKSLGQPITVTELVSATGLIYGGKKTIELADIHPEEAQIGPVGVQLFGDQSVDFLKAFEVLQGQDFSSSIHFIDINMGCPVPKVVKKGGGSALLRDADNLYLFLKKLSENSPWPITVKMRTGWDDSQKNGVELVQAIESAGIQAIAVHGRTRAQGYSGLADWDFIHEMAAATKLPLIGNGDVLGAQQALTLLKRYPKLSGIMIGRGCLKDPWIFWRIQKLLDPNFQNQPLHANFVDLLKEFSENLSLLNNEHFSLIQLKKFASWFSHGLSGAAHFRGQVFAQNSLAEILKASAEFFQAANWETSDAKDFSPILMGGHG